MGVSRGRPGPDPRIVGGAGTLAAILFMALFRFRRLGPLDFWTWLVLNIAIVVAASFFADRGYGARLRRDAGSGLIGKAALGLASAGLLYAVFFAGRVVALRIFPFAGTGIARVYGLKEGVPLLRVALLIGLAIGPGEELFWRGFFQERLGALTGRGYGLVLTALLYTAVHLTGGNLMLVLAAAVCALFWGWLYWRFHSPVVNMISHAVWDLMVFVLFPF